MDNNDQLPPAMEEKTNEHIRADKTAFTRAYLGARDELGRLDGVVGVGFGRKEVNGAFTDDIAIEVFVREKRPPHALTPEQRVPPRYQGYRTDVRTIPRGQETADTGGEDTDPYPTIKGGIPIEAFPMQLTPFPAFGDRAKGTLGCIVKKRGDSGSDNVFMLTCQHVLTNVGSGAGDYVYQPLGPISAQGDGPGRVIAKTSTNLFKDYKFENALSATAPTAPPHLIACYVDAGVAKILVQSQCCDTPCGSGTPVDTTIVGLQDLGLSSNAIADVRNLLLDVDILSSGPDKHVFKRGTKTRGTKGLVTAVNASLNAYDENGNFVAQRNNVIEIAYDVSAGPATNNQGNQAFSDHGDSGAIVLDAQNRAVGMIFAEEQHAPKTSPTQVLTYKSYACHIVAVLDALEVCVVTNGGTSYGACGATDGSGLVASVDLSADAGGERAFATAERRGFATRSITRDSARPNFAPLTESQRERFIRLREELRETSRGRLLDDTFLEVREEIGVLVRSCRPVTVAWHRARGPAFLAHIINHLRGGSDVIPREICGISRLAMLARMREALLAHGSGRLRRAIERHTADLPLLAEFENIDDCVAALRPSDATIPA